MSERAWSPYQQTIFDFVSSGTGNGIVEAVAGSGKSTTIVEASKRIPSGKTHIMLAFNKSIQVELQNRGVNAKTFHSLTYGPVLRSKKTNNVETNKLRFLCKQNMPSDDNFIYGAFACKLVGLARNAGVGVLVPDTEESWYDLLDHHDLELENERGTTAKGVEYARELLQWSCESNLVDFDDMLYLAVKDGIVLPKFDFVFVDEAQDTNAIQRAILRKILHPASRVVFVGDPAQAIYGFRGADSNSMSLLEEEFACQKLPLTISYRCATNVVAQAHKYVSHIEASPEAPEGIVKTLGPIREVVEKTATGQGAEGTEWFLPTDLVVCRTTKPLVELAFKLIKRQVPVKIMGRDIGNGLKTLIGKMRADNVDDLAVKIEAWAMREIDKAIAKQMPEKADQAQDKCDAVLCLIEALPETSRTLPTLLEALEALFNNDNPHTLTLATIHKAKGMEADRVFWLNYDLCPARWAKQEWQKEQERNLCYVAITRAKHTLFYVEDGAPRKRDHSATLQQLFARSARSTEEAEFFGK